MMGFQNPCQAAVLRISVCQEQGFMGPMRVSAVSTAPCSQSEIEFAGDPHGGDQFE
ncbi:MAG: hypothetical protein JF606_15380 [Burkholderiales bacterium]|nr:hypothetical protein [Burkholderiales bacterium]